MLVRSLLFTFFISWFSVVIGQNNVTCDCDCSIFQSTMICALQRLTIRTDCPCCQTCLRQSGELCDPVAFPCDEEFGLSCNAKTDTCEGPYKLRSVATTHNVIQVAWHRPFPSQGQLYLFYTQKYTNDLRGWIMQEVDYDDSASIPNLQAATYYYITLIPGPLGNLAFENRSEILAAKTEGCLHRNQSYAIGEEFSDGCNFNCTCTPEGHLACVERKCPLGYKRGDIRDSSCKEHDDPASEDPCCVIYLCQNNPHAPVISTSDEHCLHRGKVYELATEFYDDNCSSLCYCDEIGVVDCRPLKCPQPAAPVNSGSCLEWAIKQTAERSPPNCCPNATCVNDGSCELNGTTYLDGARIPSSCDKRCICQAGHVLCESACPETISEPPVTEQCTQFALKNDSANCCLEWTCVASTKHCLHDGTMYRIGQSFTDVRNCRLRNCTCVVDNDGTTHEVCSGGCPEISAEMLNPDKNCSKPLVYQPADSCQCPVVKCSEKRLDEINATPEAPLYFLTAALVNSSSAELILNISENLRTNKNAILEIHVARLVPENSKNNSLTWQISGAHLPSVESSFVEYVSGLRENTTYQIKARLIILNSAARAEVTLPFTPVVVLNVPPKLSFPGMGCIVNGSVQFEDGVFVPHGCGQECICKNGSLLCRPTQCAIQDSILLASEFCPVPVLVKSPGACCPHWECHAKPSGCKYGDTIYQNGDSWRNGCAEECSCRNGLIICRNLCHDLQLSLPHPSCKAVEIPGSCCPVWTCQEGVSAPLLDFANDLEPPLNLSLDSISSSLAKLRWQKPADLRIFFGYSLTIEEVLVDRESFREIKLIHPDVNEYLVHDLSPATKYRATLKALEEGNHVLRVESMDFRTLGLSEITISLWLEFIGVDKAEAIWDCQHCEDLRSLKLNLLSSNTPAPQIGDVTPGLPKITLTALNPTESYQLWLDGVTKSGSVIKSNVLAFTTRAVADFNEILKDFQNATTLSRPLYGNEQKLSTALIIVAALCGFLFFAFLMAVGMGLRYKRAIALHKANAYHNYNDQIKSRLPVSIHSTVVTSDDCDDR